MCEVTSSNFFHFYPLIINEIDRSCFLAFDTEFSSIDNTPLISMNTFEEFYRLRSNFIRQITVFQFGLAIFFRTNQQNKYEVKIYNFYLHPSNRQPIDVQYQIQSSSIQFLTDYKFDFNKCFYSGISFANQTQINLLMKHKSQSYRFSIQEQNFFDKLFEIINQWLITAELGQQMTYEHEFERDFLSNYSIQMEIQRYFKTIWTTIETESQTQKKIFVFERITREDFEEKSRDYQLNNNDWTEHLQSIVGFSKLIHYIRDNYQKPIVGHNCFLDWLIIYDKFLDRLPIKFQDFQQFMTEHIHSALFDTKYLAFEMKTDLFSSQRNLTTNTSLSSLFNLLSSKTYDQQIFLKPVIEILSSDRYQNQTRVHEAGYDAYMSGVIFLKLIYFHKQKQTARIESNAYQTIFDICLNDIQMFKNRFYSIVNCYVPLNRNDQLNIKKKRFQYCLVLEKINRDKIEIESLIKQLISYGFIQYEIDGNFTRLYLFFQSEHGQKRIMNDYKHHSIYKIEKFNWFKHRFLSKYSAGISILLGGICIFLLVKSRL